MKRALILIAVLAMAAGSADAKGACKDAKGKFTKCPPATTAMAATPAAPAMSSAKAAKVCKKGKACGNSCISMKDTCHKPS